MSSLDPFFPENRRRLFLKRGRKKAVENRHPWIFEGSVAREEGPVNAALADLFDEAGRLLASGFYSMHSQIRLRALTFGEEVLSGELIRNRIRASIERRRQILTGDTTAARLIHSEGDELSGLVLDLYGDVAVVEITSAGLDRIRSLVLEEIRQVLRPSRIVERNDVASRRIEQLTLESVTTPSSAEPRIETIVRENGLAFSVDPERGQKTGFFLDQRDNRRIAEGEAGGKRVLNLFSYSGAFGVYAMRGGAESVQQVDVSAPALELARRNHALNGQNEGVEFVNADAFDHVRALGLAGEQFDLVICDPPAFAKSKGEVDRAARGYKDINLYAIRLVAPGGLLMTFSCSGHVSGELFQKIVFAAALDTGRQVAIVRKLGAGKDHPVSLYCPEGEYLKGLVLQVQR